MTVTLTPEQEREVRKWLGQIKSLLTKAQRRIEEARHVLDDIDVVYKDVYVMPNLRRLDYILDSVRGILDTVDDDAMNVRRIYVRARLNG